jgi:hypothetical protein
VYSGDRGSSRRDGLTLRGSKPDDLGDLMKGVRCGRGEGQKDLFDDLEGLASGSVLGGVGHPLRKLELGGGGGVPTIAARIAGEFRKRGRIDFVGQTVRDAHSLMAERVIGRLGPARGGERG